MDADHLEHRLEDGCADVCACWQTDNNDGTSGADILGGLLEWLLVDGDKDDGVGTETVGCGGADILGDVAGLGEVDESLRQGLALFVTQK